MRITFVKKILADGQPCRKCADVESRLAESGQMSHIDRVVIADERDPASEGMRLAMLHDVVKAPFFIVEHTTDKQHSDEDGPRITVYTVYLRFVRDVFGGHRDNVAEAREAMRANPDLGLI
ncbi:MAG: hypothetical protein J4F38_00535 [Pseudomonadales bacterium]|nr:hypothetical protein [Pseudomonadales bacterium]